MVKPKQRDARKRAPEKPAQTVVRKNAEPYAAQISDEQRRALRRRVEEGEATDAEQQKLAFDGQRAIKKVRAAIDQIAHPGDPLTTPFAAPEDRAQSAVGTLSESILSPDEWKELTQRQAHKKSQRQNARQPRSPVREIIRKLLGDYPEATARELWQQFLGYSDRDFSVKDCGDHAEWDAAKRVGEITYDAFSVAVTREKKKVT